MAAAETDGKKMQPAVATKAAERRDTEKPGTEHKVPETKTEEAPAEKGSVPAAERNTPVAEARNPGRPKRAAAAKQYTNVSCVFSGGTMY